MSRETVKKLLIIIIILIFLITTMILVDINQIIRSKEPRFIFKTNTYDYNNIVVNEYIGLGYKIIKYNSDKEGQKVRVGTIFLIK